MNMERRIESSNCQNEVWITACKSFRTEVLVNFNETSMLYMNHEMYYLNEWICDAINIQIAKTFQQQLIFDVLS